MIHIALKSEYSFQQCFYPLGQLVSDTVERCNNMGVQPIVGVADQNNTFAHVPFEQECKKQGVKPIFGVRLQATDGVEKARSARASYKTIVDFTLLAKNDDGLVEIYKLVKKAYDQFYYIPRLYYYDIHEISDDVIVMCEFIPLECGKFDSMMLQDRVDYFTQSQPFITAGLEGNVDRVATPLILYPKMEDRPVYECLSHFKGTNSKTFNTSLGSFDSRAYKEKSIELTFEIANQCNAKIHRADMIKYIGNDNIKDLCIIGAIKKEIDLDDKIYKARFERELDLITKKGFSDYFLIVSDMLSNAKKNLLVGPGRGSSGGSLICYLLGITELDPIKHGLLFERFVDINRSNLPDVDTDIPDIGRKDVIKYLNKKYGNDNVISIGNISKYKPKSAIVDFSKALLIPAYDTNELKDSIIERSSGDARAALCIEDTLTGTEAGRNFIEKYPEMSVISKIEGHARHSGKHAAGTIVSNLPSYTFGGINSRDSVLMMDHWQAEDIGLLKIDILGLRTLTILQEAADLAGFDFHDFYKLPLDDDKALKVLNDCRLSGIFQFEGKALGIVTKQMGVESFDDICAITSLGRPGALNSGGTEMYIKRRLGEDVVVSYGDIYDKITKDTYGIVIYQEQTMTILKEIGNLSWEDVNTLRKALSKSYGDEFFAKYKDMFINGAIENGYSESESLEIWKAVASMGSYGFNKSHAVAYSMISYWTAWCKAHYPLEFAAANLNHARDDKSAIRILRDFVVNDGIEYIALDPDESDIKWTIKDGKLLGGLINIDGIGVKKAQDIIKRRECGEQYTPAIAKKLLDPKTAFDILFPAEHFFGDLYKRPHHYGINGKISKIKDIDGVGEYYIIGKVLSRDLRDRNDVQSVIKRGCEVDSDRFYLNLIVEDDTDNIRCMIPPFAMDKLNGLSIAEKAIPDKTWFIIKGSIVDENWMSISIERITELKEGKYNV